MQLTWNEMVAYASVCAISLIGSTQGVIADEVAAAGMNTATIILFHILYRRRWAQLQQLADRRYIGCCVR